MGTAASDDAEASFQHLMDSAPVMIWVSGTDKLCTWFNRPWLEFTGRTLAQERGNGWAEGVHPDDLARCLDHYVSHFDRHVPFRIEYRLRRADGAYRWILDTGVPRFDAQQRFLGYIGSCIDINASKRAKAGLKDTAAHQMVALDALERIAGGIAHEFSNLVAAFLSDLWAIRKHANEPAAGQQRALEAETAALEGGRIIERLLASVRQRPEAEALHVNRLVGDTWTILRGAAGEHVRIEMDLAAAPDDAKVDPAHLQAALLNLVANARDAMSDGGTVTLTTRTMSVRPEAVDDPDLPPGRYIVLAVGDTGTGMSEDVARHAFEPFFTTKDVGRGTGLGLSQVRAFARHSGGAAHIESAPGKGTTVRIYLPHGNGADTERAEHG